MRRLLATLGHPERAYRSVIVAGTNGKGSTAATLAAILQASGYRTGFYSSPHLVSLLERWRIAGANVTASRFRSAVKTLQRAVRDSGVTPTYFEALTLVGFVVFREEACDVVVLEVGMGGRLDATNVVDPVVSVITSISLDHTEYLGSTIGEIATEKAGVIHGAPAVTSNRDPEALKQLGKRAAEAGARLHVVARESMATRLRSGASGTSFALRTPEARYALDSPLAGAHQVENISLAVRAAEIAREALPRITRSSIVRGVAETDWRGRLETFRDGRKTIVVDGAHNPDAAEKIAAFIARETRPRRALVFAVMQDKEYDRIAAAIFPLFDRIVLTLADRQRGLDPHALASLVPGRTAVEIRPSMAAAFAAAVAGSERTVVVAGSLYLAGAAVAWLDRRRAAKRRIGVAKQTSIDRAKVK